MNNSKKKVSEFGCDAGTLVFIAIAIAITIIGFGKALMEKTPKVDASEGNEKIEVTTTVTISKPEYEPKYQAKNVFFKVDGSSTGDEFVNVRSNPNMSDKEKIGKLPSGQEFVSKICYVSDEFYGFPVEALNGKMEEVIDEDGIVWMSRYYLKVAAYDYPELAKDEGDPSNRIETNYTKLTIINGSPRVRSTPTAKDYSNFYGILPEGTVIEASAPIIVNDNSYTFYGVRAADLEWALETVGFGNIWYDADGIIWISAEYAEIS